MEVMNNILETCVECLPSSFLICKHFLYFLYTLPFCFRDAEECEDSSYEAHTSVQPEGGGSTCNRTQIRHLVHPFTLSSIPMAMVRSTKTLLATKPRMKLAQMLTELVTARTRGGSISATTTQTSVP